MQAIQNFAFEEHLIRAVEYDGDPWFVGKDVCSVLDIRDHHQALERLDDDERGGYTIPTPSGDQSMIIVSEAGVYRLVFRSRKPEAERFKRWLAHEVLPQIRKTGAYAAPQPDPLVETIDLSREAPLAARIDAVRMARVLFGTDRARALWGALGLPAVPPADEWSGSGETKRILSLVLDAELGGVRVRDLILDAYNGDEQARLTLLDFGVRVAEEGDGFWLGHSVPPLRKLLTGSAFNSGWVLVLRRIPGARPGERQSFVGRQSRTTWLPLSALDRDEKPLHN